MEKEKKRVSNRELLQVLILVVLFGWFCLSIDVLSETVLNIKNGQRDIWSWGLTIGAVVALISSLLVPFLWKTQILSTEECNRNIKMNLTFWFIWIVAAVIWKLFF